MKIMTVLTLAVFLFAGAQTAQAAAKRNAGDYLPTEQTVNQTSRYSGNVKTKKYHNSGCKFYNCRDCTRYFKTPQAAKKAGFEPCKVCWK